MAEQLTDVAITHHIADLQNAIQTGLDRPGEIAKPRPQELAKYIDHTLLKLDATPEQIDDLCNDALQWDFKTVCIRLKYVSRAFENLHGSNVAVCCVVGFPEGTQELDDKLREAQEAVRDGATELDTVINVRDLHQCSYGTIFAELASFRAQFPRASQSSDGITLKLILETSQLSHAEKIAASTLASAADFDYIKTSTGFLGHGASVEDVRLMYRIAQLEGKGMKVKASGGVRTFKDAIAMVEAGAERLGVSAGVVIMKEATESGR